MSALPYLMRRLDVLNVALMFQADMYYSIDSLLSLKINVKTSKQSLDFNIKFVVREVKLGTKGSARDSDKRAAAEHATCDGNSHEHLPCDPRSRL